MSDDESYKSKADILRVEHGETSETSHASPGSRAAHPAAERSYGRVRNAREECEAARKHSVPSRQL